MKYSDELIKEVKELYPNSETMILYAETGNQWLGRYLDDSSSGAMPIKDVLDATSLEELRDKAKLALRKVELYIKWGKEYDASRNAIHQNL